MCGLVGMAGHIGTKEEKMFTTMLLLDVVRGKDSTGVAFVGRNHNKAVVEKELGHPLNLMEKVPSSLFNKYSGVLKGINKVFIGHNRAATLGAVDKDNAHPFRFGNIVGAHNGTLRDWADLEGYKEFDVDSKALFHTINEKGVEHAWKSFLGAAAITYWNEGDNTLNIVRNSERPLVYAQSESGDCLFWASEPWMITVAASKAGVKLMKAKEKELPRIVSFAEDTHFCIEVSPNNWSIKSTNKLEKKKISSTSTTGVTTMGAGFKYKGPKNYYTASYSHNRVKKDKRQPINVGWAKDLLKAPKSFRKQEGKLESVFENGNVFYAVLRLDDGSPVQVYPSDRSSIEKWVDRLSSDSTMYFQINFRPRVIYNNKNEVICYKIAESGVRMSRSQHKRNLVEKKNTAEVFKLYMGPNGPLLKEEWESAVRKLAPSCSCANCTNPLDINDHRDILWVSDYEAYCTDCSSNPGVMSLVMSNHAIKKVMQ